VSQSLNKVSQSRREKVFNASVFGKEVVDAPE